MANLIRLSLLLILGYLFTVIWLWGRVQSEQGTQAKEEAAKQQRNNLLAVQPLLQHGYLSSTVNNEKFHSKDLPKAISHIPGNESGSNYVWQDRDGDAFAYAAMGLDRQHYFANSYLIGYQPYKTDKLWQPLVTLALRKTYQFDHDQHGSAIQDVWQNSRQAYLYSHGDCEDHAILLADWLISMGYDARVVIGRVPSGGHAWVILFHDGKEYLLESTSKRRPRSIGDFTLAKYAPDYQPEFLFNREQFWVNTGPSLTTRYSGKQWKETSRFYADKLTTK